MPFQPPKTAWLPDYGFFYQIHPLWNVSYTHLTFFPNNSTFSNSTVILREAKIKGKTVRKFKKPCYVSCRFFSWSHLIVSLFCIKLEQFSETVLWMDKNNIFWRNIIRWILQLGKHIFTEVVLFFFDFLNMCTSSSAFKNKLAITFKIFWKFLFILCWN